MQRIAIIGPVGAGKTTLGREIASLLGLPRIDLDDILLRAGTTPAEWLSAQADLLRADEWVISGDYREIAEQRLHAADTIVWLDLPWPVCIWRALRHGSDGFGSPVPRRTYAHRILRYPRHGRRQTKDMLDQLSCARAVYRLRSSRQVADFFHGLAVDRQ